MPLLVCEEVKAAGEMGNLLLGYLCSNLSLKLPLNLLMYDTSNKLLLDE